MKNAAFVILSVALGGWTVSCGKQDVRSKESLSLEFRGDSITDFAGFLEGLSHLVQDQLITLRIPENHAGKKLVFSRLSEFPIEPLSVLVSPDSVSTGYGPSYTPMTLDEFRNRLVLFKEAATAAQSPSFLMLLSERRVSGEFGFSILGVIADSGIDFVALAEPDTHEKKPPSDSDNPKPEPPRSPRRVIPLWE
jgi:hypothetical protein